MKNDHWIDALLAPLMLALLLWTQEVCAASQDRWHVMSIDGTAVGSMHESETRTETGWVSIEEATVVLNRMGSRLEIHTYQKSVEDDAGHLQSVRLEMTTSDQTMVSRGHRIGDEWVIRSGDDSVPERRRALAGPLLGPRGIRARLAELRRVGDSTTYQAFIAHLGQPGAVRAELTGFEQLGDQRLRVLEETLPGIPAPMTRLIDSQGYGVVIRMPGPFGQTETVLADETAARLASAGGELGEEVFEATMLKTGVRLPHPRSIEYLELELRHRNPALGWPALDSRHQEVLAKTPERLVLAIHRRHPRQSSMLGEPGSGAAAPFLESNAILQANQPEVIELANRVIGDERDTWKAVQRLERWVADNMAFDMGVVLAPSSEVLANRRGTCTEYAILLTTLARAAGIPARYVGGYVYAHGMFGGHAWAEVLIGEEWVALDAAIPADGPADAARIAFQWTSLNDGIGELNAGPAMQMYGQIDARVMAWKTADGPMRRFEQGAPAPELVNGRFVDRAQGIEWSVPAGWRIVDYTDTWPSNRIAAAEDEQGARVELRWVAISPWESAGEERASVIRSQVDGWSGESIELHGRRAWWVEREERPALAIAGRAGFWVLDGESRDELQRLAASLSLPSS